MAMNGSIIQHFSQQQKTRIPGFERTANDPAFDDSKLSC